MSLQAVRREEPPLLWLSRTLTNAGQGWVTVTATPTTTITHRYRQKCINTCIGMYKCVSTDMQWMRTYFIFFPLHSGKHEEGHIPAHPHQRLMSLMEWRPSLPLPDGHCWPRWCVTWQTGVTASQKGGCRVAGQRGWYEYPPPARITRRCCSFAFSCKSTFQAKTLIRLEKRQTSLGVLLSNLPQVSHV